MAGILQIHQNPVLAVEATLRNPADTDALFTTRTYSISTVTHENYEERKEGGGDELGTIEKYTHRVKNVEKL